MALIVHAPNVHQGGGRTLLLALLEAAGSHDVLAIVDERLPLPAALPPGVRISRVPPTLSGRACAEFRLRRLATSGTTVLCFGNLPPLLPVGARVVLFLQNRYLLGGVPVGGFPLRVRVRIALEKLWLRSRTDAAHTIVVQTPSMARAAKQALGVQTVVLPFLADPSGYSRQVKGSTAPGGKQHDFLYVASGEPHKNHATLIAAWEVLAAEGIFPSLCLTLSRAHHAELCARVEVASGGRIRIHNVEAASSGDIQRLYRSSAALIHPATFESFGLPLIEARAAGLGVLAPEADYVRDVIDPDESFDPGSAVSIARAVKRFMGIAEAPLPVTDAAGFLRHLAGGPGA